jgi:hypothetical protein
MREGEGVDTIATACACVPESASQSQSLVAEDIPREFVGSEDVARLLIRAGKTTFSLFVLLAAERAGVA